MKFPSVLSLLIIALNCSTLLAQYVDSGETPRVITTAGPIKGKSVLFRGTKVFQFLNIPYGEAPVGQLRFKKPVAKKSWDNEYLATEWGAHCMQPDLPTMNTGATFTEDCLTLNVFTSRRGFHEGIKKPKPVMVWIHGGGFIFGSAHAKEHYDGTALAALKDVILVSINYRVGPLGFLRLPEAGAPGNMGLWDQLLALKWVRDNIKKFGGDPDQVTIFGESAGSISVSAHVVSAHSKGLFKNAIVQSGSIFDIDRWTIGNLSAIFIDKIGCTKDVKICLRDYRPRETNPLADILLFWPVYGDEFLPEAPEEMIRKGTFNKEVNLMAGTVGNEGAVLGVLRDITLFNPVAPAQLDQDSARHYLSQLFGQSTLSFYASNYLKNAHENDSQTLLLSVAAALGDTYIGCPTYAFAQSFASASPSKVYGYHQTQRPSSRNLIGFTIGSEWMSQVASHCNDIPMVFGLPFLEPETHDVDDALLSSLMMDAWTTFARTGKPSNIGSTEWTAWQSTGRRVQQPTMILDSKRIGILDSTQTDHCLINWPFPREEGIYWHDPIKPYPGPQQIIEHHTEF